MQTKIDHQKYVADIVLSKLRLLDTWCIVAGGAPRDWYLGNEAKDIDVYLYDSRKIYIHADLREGLLKELGFEIESKHEDWTVPELYQSNHLVRHLYNSIFLGEKVQIIFMGEPTFTSVVDMFPISISKVWYKGGVINTTDDFDLSVKHKILYKTRDNYAEDDRYLLKIREKFSDYTYMTEEEAYKLEQDSQETKVEELAMKMVIISPDFDESIAFHDNFPTLTEGFKKLIDDRKMSNNTFLRAYGDWQVYSEEGSSFIGSKLVRQGTVDEFIY